MANDYTIMLLTDKGKTKLSFKTNLFILFLLFIVFIALVVSGLFSLRQYVELKQHHEHLLARISSLKHDIEKLAVENREAELYKKWADRIIYRRLQYEETTDNKSLSAAGILTTEPADAPGKNDKTVDIDGFEVRALNLELDFDVFFNLVNRTRDNRRVSGYAFIVASNQDVKPEIYRLWPQAEHVSGVPEDYRKGDSFSIRYMKQVKGRIIQPSIGEKFNRVDVIVYSENGTILLKKGFYIQRLLIPPPPSP